MPFAGQSSVPPMPPAYCRMFLDARRILGLGEWDLAQRLGTTVDTIRALESGHLSALPPWPETSRIVTSYLTGLGMDARPVLHSLAHDLTMLAAASQPSHGPGGSAAALRSSVPRRSSAEPAHVPSHSQAKSTGGTSSAKAGPPSWVVQLGRTPRNVAGAVDKATQSVMSAGRRAARRVSTANMARAPADAGRPRTVARATIAALLIALLLATVAQTSLAGSVMTAAAVPLPATLARAFGKVADMLRVQLAPVRDGLRWIEVEDPRSRRGDKLQTARR